MNGKQAKALRKITGSRKEYQAAKRSVMADNGQNPKPLDVRKNRPKEAIKPTWPASANQKRQSRPVIVVHPVKQLCAGLKENLKREIRAEYSAYPKHELDAAALIGFAY